MDQKLAKKQTQWIYMDLNLTLESNPTGYKGVFL
jgi:hypothetical protein